MVDSRSYFGVLRRRVHAGSFVLEEVRDDPHDPVPEHTHSQAHFCLVLDAGYQSSAAGADGPCERGTLLYHPAGTNHADRYLRRGGRFLVVRSVDEPGFAVDGCGRLPRCSSAFGGPRVALLCERLGVEAARSDSSSTLALDSLFHELLSVVATLPESRGGATWLPLLLGELADPSASFRCVEELASFAGVHPVHLARVFRNQVGLAPGEVLRWNRMQTSLVALRKTKLPLVDIALDAGFADQSSFTRAFRSLLGVTPGRYRRLTS